MDDTLLLVKLEDIGMILKKFSLFNKCTQFTIDMFLNRIVHFFDIKTNGNKTNVYCKEIHTGQDTHFASNIWQLKTTWIQSLHHRPMKICNNNILFKN